ncbi:unnamed protein product, partial [Meganyctiphanes norvegica]
SSVSPDEEVKREERRTALVLGARGVGILQLLATHRNKLALCTVRRLLSTHDVPQLLAQLLNDNPWKTTAPDGQPQFFDNGVWMPQEDMNRLTQTECQMLVTLHCLLLDRETVAFYELNSVRRGALLKLRPLLREEILNQIPALEGFARWLAALAMFVPQDAR